MREKSMAAAAILALACLTGCASDGRAHLGRSGPMGAVLTGAAVATSPAGPVGAVALMGVASTEQNVDGQIISGEHMCSHCLSTGGAG